MTQKTILGQAEIVTFPLLKGTSVSARIDTGAKTSSIWACEVHEAADGLRVVFFGHGSPLHNGIRHVFPEYEETIVASSNGFAEKRYKVKLSVVIGGRRIRAWFTLADRSTQLYPVLIGRNLLNEKFIVDVALGDENTLSRDKIQFKVLHHAHDPKRSK